jgi:hypothetical protein
MGCSTRSIRRCSGTADIAGPRALLVLIFALLLVPSQDARAGATYRVGPGCTYATIQAAIDAIPNQGSGVIRVGSGSYNENLAIIGKTVDLIGGHSNCVTTSPTGTTSINGGSTTSSVITFFVISGAADQSHSLIAERLLLFNGTGNALSPGGGITVSTTSDRSAQVTLINTFVRNNETAFAGGGISMVGRGSLTLLENSQIEGNIVAGDDPDGGGLYCSGDVSVAIFGGGIFANRAGEPGVSNGRGGGVFLDGCDLTWFSQSALATSDDASLRNNTVHGSGGGLYARGGAQVELIGASFSFGSPVSARPLRIRDNRAIGVTEGGGTAGGRGGGVYAEGVGTTVLVDRAWTYNNESDAVGGAFSLFSDAVLEVTRSSATCHTPRNCSRVFDNHARIAGGAIDAFRAEAAVRRTIVTGNDSVFGGLLTRGTMTGFDSTLRLEDSLLHGDVGPGHSLAAWDTTLFVIRSTIADTAPTRAVFGMNGTSTLVLFDSIVHEVGGQPILNVVGGTPQATTQCVVWHDNALAALGPNERTLVGDPRFADREDGLFYLTPDSPAINYCGNEPSAPAVDLEWNPRGICHSVNPPLCLVDQIYDLGAYELPLGIFRDRFESPFL